MIGGNFDGGAGSSYQGGAATSGDQYTTSSFGGFNINAAPAWGAGAKSGGGMGVDTQTLMIGAGLMVFAWFALSRKK